MKTLCLVVPAICLLGAMNISAKEWFVGPAGTPEGDGRKLKPLELSAALNSATSPVKPGDVIYVLPGQYDGKMEGQKRVAFTVNLSGAPGQPIRVEPAPGTALWDAPLLNGGLEFTSSHVHVIGLQIGDLKWDRTNKTHEAVVAFNTTGGRDSKLIDCNLFGGRMGSGVWVGAINFEMRGTIIHDFGTVPEGQRGSGHAVYTQNGEGTKVYSKNMFYRGCGWNFDIYTQQNKIEGFDVIENISFLAGHYKEGQTSFSYGLQGWQTADRIRFEKNIGYQPRSTEKWRANARLIYHRDPEIIHGTGSFNDNTIMGAARAFSVSRWKSLTVTGNTFWATEFLFDLATAPGGSGANVPGMDKPDPKNYTINQNTYFSNGNPKPFRFGAGIEEFQPGETLTFKEWQALGFDKDSRFIEEPKGRPTGTKVFVIPTETTPGRAHVGIFNWDDKDTIEVDLGTAVKSGQKIRIYNVLDITQTFALAKPVLSVTYLGKPLSFPLRKDKDCPNFDAFLILPEGQ